MTDQLPPPPPSSPPPPPQRATRASLPLPQMPARDGKSVSFYLAIFLALLLFVSGGLNLLLLFFSAIGSTAGGLSSYSDESDAGYEIVTVGGDRGADDQLLLVPIQGAISEAPSALLGAGGGTVSQVRRALRLAARDDSIKGVLFDINSPGGGVTASEELHRLISEFRADTDKPVLALFGDVAASGGYYMAVACDEIMARRTTITGSIGVIMQSYNFTEAAKKLGITQETIISESTPFKDIMSMTRPMRDEERAILTSIVDEMYERFVTVVDEGRPSLSRERVGKLADGRIYSASQAREVGLVDRIGSIDDAYDRLAGMCSVDQAVVVQQRRLPTLADVLFGASAKSPVPSWEQAVSQLVSSVSAPRFLYYWAGAR